MTDTVIKFPKPITASLDMSKGNNETKTQIDNLIKQEPPENGADVYSAVQLLAVPSKIQTKPDFATGGHRNPHWGLVMSFSLMPELSKVPVGSLILPNAPSQLLAADTLEALRERALFELDRAISLARIAEKDPEGYATYERALMQRMQAPSDEVHGS